MSTATEPGKVVVFYSFKGGTGRSMSLANVACVLASAGSSVLMIDWDLEAPGLHRYFKKQMFGVFRGDERAFEQAPGLIDLFSELSGELDSESADDTPQDYEGATALLKRVPVNDYILRTDIANLSLLKAGRFDEHFAATVGNFQWPQVYRRSPALLRVFGASLARNFDYVLIDSRTGFTDTSGICTMLMPEMLVAVFTPNLQSTAGVVDLVRQAVQYRAASDDIRPLVVYPLPSRIEASEPALRKQWRYGDSSAGVVGFQPAFEQVFSEVYQVPGCDLGHYFDDIQIQHVPRYAYGEEIAVLREESRDRLSLTHSYEGFTRRLIDGKAPWLIAPDDRPVNDESVVPMPEEEALRELAAASSMQRLKERFAALQRRNKILQWSFSSAVVLTFVTAAVSALHFGGADLTRGVAFVLGVAVLSLVAMSGSQYRLGIMSGLIKEMERELTAFEDKIGRYDAKEALQKLLIRTESISREEPLLHLMRARATKRRAIYISYRREDSASYVAHVYKQLRSEGEHVFVDVDSIKPGDDFRTMFEQQIRESDIVLALIGQNWLGAVDATGQRRINSQHDFVRTELAIALAGEAQVIPVLVDGARMPDASALPTDLQPLVRRNAVELSTRRLDSDIVRLQSLIERIRAVN